MTRLPAEWEPQAAVMLTWPHAGTDWAPRLAAVEALYRDLAAAIAAREPVLVVCRDAAHRARVAVELAVAGAAPGRIRFALAPSNDTWARDHGPITVLDAGGRAALLDFRFNGWGAKHPADLDDRISETLHAAGVFPGTPLHPSALVLEGGAIDTDGCGTLLAVRRTIIDPARNPGWSQERIEGELRRHLGVERILWLDHGALTGDDTDGHIDTLARFCDPQTLCYAQAPGPDHPDAAELDAMHRELQALRQPDGTPYRLIPLPLPKPIRGDDGEQLPATYANFLIVDGAVLVPTYADPADDLALARLQGAFPDRAVVGIDCRALITEGGSLHCITMQLPAAVRLS